LYEFHGTDVLSVGDETEIAGTNSLIQDIRENHIKQKFQTVENYNYVIVRRKNFIVRISTATENLISRDMLRVKLQMTFQENIVDYFRFRGFFHFLN